MTRHVDFYFDVGSPASYLAWAQLPDIAAAAGAEIIWKPMLLGGVFKATGNRSPVEVPAKGEYTHRDLARHAERYQVAFRHNPHFPINTLLLMRGAEAMRDTPDFQPYLQAVFHAMWVEPRNLNEPNEVAHALEAGGFDPAAVLERAQLAPAKDGLKTTTQEAVDRGVFGAPTFFVGDTMWFGQDRLDWVADALNGPVQPEREHA
ncbi:2-hydroxychromene-2-carboxylate isomerase [Aquisalimonas sp.]|uniref:2-hydroxychromene-2-carboxylate isomerase n=1 Tax=unclassified Aquisalimonas TaxID=2644645 RepID=UPI0025C1C9DD|nr:2-hydroxychromene-2-carboxylate isomerase [Aquisalimonas sp.]